MTNMDPEAINARAAALQEATGERLSRMKRRNEAMLQAQSRMKNITATATSPDNAVQATVDSGGMLVDLRISPTAKGDIARLVVDAVQRAAAQVRSETHRLHEELRRKGYSATFRSCRLHPRPSRHPPARCRPAPRRPVPSPRAGTMTTTSREPCCATRAGSDQPPTSVDGGVLLRVRESRQPRRETSAPLSGPIGRAHRAPRRPHGRLGARCEPAA